MAVTPILAQKGALMMYVGATEEAKKMLPTAFRIYPDPLLTARNTVKLFVPNLASARLAIIVSNDDFGSTVAKAITEGLARSSATPIAVEKYDSATPDFRPMITGVLGKSPTVIYLAGVGNPLGRLVSQLRQLGFQGDIIGGPEMQFSDFIASAGSAAEGAKFLDISYSPDSPDEPTASFVRDWRVERSCSDVQIKGVEIAAAGWTDFGGQEFLEDGVLG